MKRQPKRQSFLIVFIAIVLTHSHQLFTSLTDEKISALIAIRFINDCL